MLNRVLYRVRELFLCALFVPALLFAEDSSNEAEGGMSERLLLAGIDSGADVERFLAELKDAVAKEDRPRLISYVQLPLDTYKNGKMLKTYRSSAELLKDFEQVFTSTVLTAIRRADYEELFVNWQGAMFGDGAIWFSEVDGAIKIKAING